MDYHASDNGETIDQRKLNLPDGSTIYGGKGNDTIIFGNVTVEGGAGNDTFQFYGTWGAVVYWNSPKGVRVDLSKGTADDGWGGTDTLVGVLNVHGSAYDDILIGNAADNYFFGNGGSNTVIGGGGTDTYGYFDVKSTEVKVSYDAASDTFTVIKHLANGDNGTDRLTGISKIEFQGDASDHVTLYKADFLPGYLRKHSDFTGPVVPNSGGPQQIADGDFNGDGNRDLLLPFIDGQSIGASADPLYVLLGDGKGGFIDGSLKVFGGVQPKLHYVPRIFVADFNHDGIDDIFAPDFGLDAPPYPGGQNSYFLSKAGVLTDASASLPQRLSQGHGASIGDVNGDGAPDLLAVSLNDRVGHAVDLYIDDGKGGLNLANANLPASLNTLPYAPGYTWSFTGDLNGDGKADLVLGGWENLTRSEVLLNDGSGHFSDTRASFLPDSGVPYQSAMQIKAIDLNHDNLPDLVISYTNGGDHASFYSTHYLQFLVNDGNGIFHDETAQRLAQTVAGDGGWYKFVDVVDLNGDGAADLVVTVSYTNGSQRPGSVVFLNDGAGHFSELYRFAADTMLHAVDVDGDGIAEIVAERQDGYSVYHNDLPRVAHVLDGGAGDERLQAPASGNTMIGGGAGLDTVVYAAKQAGFSVLREGDVVFVTRPDGTVDTLVGVERVAFSDADIGLDLNGAGGQAYRVYQAAFDRKPDAGGLGYWIAQMDLGASLRQVAQAFVDSTEFKNLYGSNPSHADIVGKFYQNVLHRTPDQGGFNYWVSVLDSHPEAVADVLMSFSESPENQAALVGVISNGFAFQHFPAG